MASPITPQNLAGSGAEHQALLDRLFGVFDGAWSWVETHLPDHALKSEIQDAIKAAHDTGAQVIKEDYETLKSQGEKLAGEAIADAKQDATTVTGQVEAVVGDVAAAASSQSGSSTSSTTSGSASTGTATSSAPSSSASGSQTSSSVTGSAPTTPAS